MTVETKLLLIERLAQGDILPEEPFLNYRAPMFLESAIQIVDYKDASAFTLVRYFKISNERAKYILNQLEFSKIIRGSTILMRDVPDLRIHLDSFLKNYDVDLEEFFEENEGEIRLKIQKILEDEAELER